jgi:hypothetical protein
MPILGLRQLLNPKGLSELFMTNEVRTYLSKAAVILKSNINLIFLPGALGVLFYIPADANQPASITFFLPLLVLFVVMPLIYGQFIEIINNNRKISYLQIFNTHWFNFFVVSLCLGIPILLINITGAIYGSQSFGIDQILVIVIHVLSIYIFPLVFLLKKRFACIPLGIKCLLGNFNYSLPLVLLAAIPTILHLISIQPSDATTSASPNFLLSYIFWLISLVIDFIVFIAAALILKEKLLPSQ